MKTKQNYERPHMRVVEIRQHGMLMQSGIKSTSSINNWNDGGTDTEDIYM